MSIESVMASNHLILFVPFSSCLQSFPASGSFPNEFPLHIRQPKYWSFSLSISPSSEYSWLISFRISLVSLQSKGLSRVFSSATIQKHQFFSTHPSLCSNSHTHIWLLEKPYQLVFLFSVSPVKVIFTTTRTLSTLVTSDSLELITVPGTQGTVCALIFAL